jgi:hypothetical protein
MSHRSTEIAAALAADPSRLDDVAALPPFDHLVRDSAEAMRFLDDLRPTTVGLGKLFTNGLAHHAHDLEQVTLERERSALQAVRRRGSATQLPFPAFTAPEQMCMTLLRGGSAVVQRYSDEIKASPVWAAA